MEQGKSIIELRHIYKNLPIGLKSPRDFSGSKRIALRNALKRELFCEMTAREREAIMGFMEHIENVRNAEKAMRAKINKQLKN